MSSQYIGRIIDYIKRGLGKSYIKDIDDFTYSKISHFNLFKNSSVELYGKLIKIQECDLKVYQDLFVYSFIKKHINKGSRILEVGGGDSRVLKALNSSYECWNVDKLEGVGNGPLIVEGAEYKFVEEYIGDFSEKIPNNYFDFTFSISALEHVKEDETVFYNILSDLDRIMKTKTMSLHCFDIVVKPESVWSNIFVNYIFDRITTLNKFSPFQDIRQDDDAFYVSEATFSSLWEPIVKKNFIEFGRPMSYNILWEKP